ncbi:hypothetical protein CKAH01_05736 [Colletotrichum kahawae]|uniref:Uncharacterized protein n=1 Tax=Colletotrichum kahawae TaxID=34407 RepID=A0AAD9YDU6_COLKA|nr:hypothetical protein CKAH01_05736 [Colletotrichum kahawae]
MVYVYRPKPSKPSSGGSSGRAAAAADGVPSTAKPAGEYDSSNNRWLVIGNTGSYDGVTDQEDLPPIPVEWIIAPNSNSSAVGNITPVGSQSTVNSAPGVAVIDDKNIGNSSENQIIETVSCVKPFDKEYVYADSYRSTIVAEMVLHIISAVFIGVTWHRFPNEIIKTYMKPKTIFMQVATGILALSAIFVVPIYWKSNRYIKHSWLWALAALLAFGTVCAAPRVYWHYSLKLPGSLWCSPKLPIQTFVWIAFSTIGWCP